MIKSYPSNKQYILLHISYLHFPIVFLWFFILFLLQISDTFAQSEVYLELRAGGTSLIGVGIGGFVPPDNSGELSAIKNTISDDLNTSGVFQVKALSDSLTAQEDLFKQWKSAGAKCYLTGDIEPSGNSVKVKLFDLNKTSILLNSEYLIDSKRPWYTAHVIVDDMIEIFTGLRGSMSSQIAFIQKLSGQGELFLINADGHDERQLTFSRTINMSPTWSPEGKYIAFCSLRGKNWLIRMINISTGQTTDITD